MRGEMRGARRRLAETLTGALVLLAALAFLAWAYARVDLTGGDGYRVVALFDRVDGLEVGADVRLSGIRVGEVVAMRLDPVTYRAEVELVIDPEVKLPLDTSAAVLSTGLLGGKYVALSPGADEELLAEGDRIVLTQPAINVEELLARFVFGGIGEQGR